MSKVPTKSEKLKYTKAAEEKRKIENDKVQEERSKKLREWDPRFLLGKNNISDSSLFIAISYFLDYQSIYKVDGRDFTELCRKYGDYILLTSGSHTVQYAQSFNDNSYSYAAFMAFNITFNHLERREKSVLLTNLN